MGIRSNTLLRILAGFGQVGLGLLMVWLCKHFIDVTIHTGSMADVWQMVALLVAVALGGIVLRQLYYYMTTLANVRQVNNIRLRIFSHMQRARLYEGKGLHSGDITSRLEKDIDAVGNACTSILPECVITLAQLLGAFLLMHSMDKRLAWLLLLMTPIVVGFGKFLVHKLRQMTLDIRQQESHIQMLVQEGMEHNEIVRTLDGSSWMNERLDDMQQSLHGKVRRRTSFTVVTRFIISACFSLGYLTAFIWGGLQLRDGVITFGVMTSFLQLVSRIQHPILSMVNMVPQLIHATASIDRLDELETMEAESQEKQVMLGGQIGVRLTDVCFRYATGDRQVLDHFTHSFLPGTKTAIMGLTGVGKTTLFRLILSLMKPQAGRLTVFNADRETEIGDCTRTNFVFVPQGNTLMSGSVRYNLQLARPEATDDELRHVLHTAMADFVLELPEGLDTMLGERGIGLSEGQAQRIAIARGLLRPGGMMLLDEISASLDEATERELYSRLFASYPEKTMLFITHRPTVCELCDEVVRL